MSRMVSCRRFRGCSRATIAELIRRLRETYCRTIGVE